MYMLKKNFTIQNMNILENKFFFKKHLKQKMILKIFFYLQKKTFSYKENVFEYKMPIAA